ncbi:UNVERIFIED_CONTAM: hypothetical protein GTU68_036017 [Idotea baltica]|nr:hypothetical protein [Idotea baltica]
MLDLGTGSGAIALALAKERPKVNMLAVDSSQAALEIAQLNADKHGLNNVEFLLSDWFEQVKQKKFDVIVSNPPYIEPNDPHLRKGDLRFEPKQALIGASDGLGDIRRIINGSSHHLNDGGLVVIEHGYDQAFQVRDLFVKHGFVNLTNRRDLNQHIRCTSGQWQAS